MAEPLGASLPINPSGGIDHRLHQGLPGKPVTLMEPRNRSGSHRRRDPSRTPFAVSRLPPRPAWPRNWWRW